MGDCKFIYINWKLPVPPLYARQNGLQIYPANLHSVQKPRAQTGPQEKNMKGKLWAHMRDFPAADEIRGGDLSPDLDD